jgi:hypothetical protein
MFNMTIIYSLQIYNKIKVLLIKNKKLKWLILENLKKNH